MFEHQIIGPIAIIKSPHLPWDFLLVNNFMSNLLFLLIKCLTINKYCKVNIDINQNHHQYYQSDIDKK